MKGFPVTRFSYLFVIVLVAFFVGGGTVTATGAVSCGNWQVISIPNVGGDDILSGMAAVPGTQDFWAVERYDGSDGFYHTLTERWNGTSWSVMSSPNVRNMNNVLNAVAVVSATDAWAVGLSGSGDGIEGVPLIEHWNGTSWSIVKSPSPSQEIYFNAVAGDSATDVWAVGFYDNANDTGQTLAEHWNGSAWSVVASPNVGSYDNVLEGVSAISTNDVWAVGESNASTTLIEHWNGTQWSIVSSPNPGGGGDLLSSAAALSSTNVWAVGSYFTRNDVEVTLIEHET